MHHEPEAYYSIGFYCRIHTASKYLHNDLARAIKALEQKKKVSLKVAIDVPMLGTIIKTNGDSLDDLHMPIGWPLLIDGAVRQFCVHRYTTIQDMQDMLKAYDLGKNSVEINKDAPQWTHFSVWNRRYMDPLPGNGGTLPKITPELTSELLHCINAIPDPWPMAKIAIEMEKPAQWVTKMCRVYFADIYARKTKGTPATSPAPAVEDTLQEVQ